MFSDKDIKSLTQYQFLSQLDIPKEYLEAIIVSLLQRIHDNDNDAIIAYMNKLRGFVDIVQEEE